MRVKSEARRLAYVQAAGAMFLQHGYADVSMEGIAAAVGGSKVTLYGYFASKEEVFEAFVVEIGRGKAQQLEEIQAMPDNPGATLLALGLAYLRLVTAPDIVALDRLIISEAVRFPELTRIFYEHGPRQVVTTMGRVLGGLRLAQGLSAPSVRLLALQFKALCEATIRDRQLWCLDPAPGSKLLRSSVDAAVALFLDGCTGRSPERAARRLPRAAATPEA